MNASLVFDGDVINIPDRMLNGGVVHATQMRGTSLELLGELACRICYDSLGRNENGTAKGRSSEALHNHILEVINLSVYEHCNFTVNIKTEPGVAILIMMSCINRKGVHIQVNGTGNLDITLNLRALLEWKYYSTKNNEGMASGGLYEMLAAYGHTLAPQICKHEGNPDSWFTSKVNTDLVPIWDQGPDQAWISLYLYGSRGFTHEQVRHRFAMSQRSTRYVDESESPWIQHPLITKFLNDEVNAAYKADITERLLQTEAHCQSTYSVLTDALTTYCKSQGLSATDARKQARGAARGYLGNALASEMIYSAPVNGWRWIIAQRLSKFADAEIRSIYAPALIALQSSVHGDKFSDFILVPSPDGMGTVLGSIPPDIQAKQDYINSLR